MIIILSISAFISIVLNLILIPRMQHLGAAITTTITELSVFLISIYFAKKHFNIKINFRMFINPLLSSFVFIPIIFLVETLSLNIGLKLMFSVALCMLSYYTIQKLVFNDSIISRIEDFVKVTFKIK